MLGKLTIRDFVLFPQIDIEFGSGLNVISGETGGGKSNLTAAISLLSGGRARREQIRKGARSAEIRGEFTVEGRKVQVVRTITPRGSGRSSIGGKSTNVSALHKTIGGLVSISGQHEQISLTDPEAHMRILDEYGGLQDARDAYRRSHDQVRRLHGDLARLRAAEQDREYRQEWLQHQIREIRSVQPQPGEDESLENEIRVLANAERISRALSRAVQLLYEGDGSATELTASAVQELQEILSWMDEADDWLESLNEASALLQETSRSMANRLDQVQMDPQAMEEKQERAFALQRLKKKHGGTIDDVLSEIETMERELEDLADISGSIDRIRSQLQEATAEAVVLAKSLSASRQDAASKLGRKLVSELESLAFTSVDLVVRVQPRPLEDRPLDALDENGCDDISFLFRPNVGEDLMALQDIASGGELSRVFLAVRAALGDRNREKVLVFDETDTGIGGKVADALGRKLHRISRTQQVLCVTHLAQIASYADTHILVEKSRKGKRTVSGVRVLDDQERTSEMARMLGGARVTRKSIEAASEMLVMARRHIRRSS